MRWSFWILAALALFAAWSSLGAVHPAELPFLQAVESADLIPYSHLEIATIESLKIGSDEGIPFLALRLFPGQPKKNNGIRAELSVDYPYKEGDTVRYSWQFRLPDDFPSDAPRNRWWVFADWHDQPDPTKGQTWTGFPRHSAPVILGYGVIEGKDMLGLSTGLDGSPQGIVPRGLIPITKGVWHTIDIKITWSQTDSGRIDLYFDGAPTPTLSAQGPDMLNGYQHYLKVGQYREPNIATDNTIDIRKVMIR